MPASLMRLVLLSTRKVLRRYPITRGMVTYSLVWPASNVMQQSLDPDRKQYDPFQTLRFMFMGTFITAPTVFLWVKIVSRLVKGDTFKHAMLKAFYDITLFAPVGQSQFYFCISFLEGKPVEACIQEVKDKVLPSWKAAACFWPFVQTLNFGYVAEKNRVIVISMGSFVWTVFLSYMHHSDGSSLPAFFRPPTKPAAIEAAAAHEDGDGGGSDARTSETVGVATGGVISSSNVASVAADVS